jgi:hypothetical protein
MGMANFLVAIPLLCLLSARFSTGARAVACTGRAALPGRVSET